MLPNYPLGPDSPFYTIIKFLAVVGILTIFSIGLAIGIMFAIRF